MHCTQVILAIAAFAGYVAAQQWTVDSSCQAANIVESCIASTQPEIDKCTASGNNYECLCLQYTNLGVCYNNCPDDPTGGSIKTSATQYCNSYSATASKSSTVFISASSSTARSASTATPTSRGSSSSTSSSSAANTTTGNAGFAVTPARSYGALAGLLAVAGAFL